MIPISDERPVEHIPWVTLVLIALCIACYFAVQPGHRISDELGNPTIERVDESSMRFLVKNAAIPCELLKGRPLTDTEFRDTYFLGDDSACSDAPGPRRYPNKLVYLALLASMFLHGSIAHLFGNMLFLWVFGNDIEARWGPWRYLGLYVAAGIVATLAHVFNNVDSTLPIIGASGAIAGIMGAYLVCYPTARIKTIVIFGFMSLRKVKAYWLLVLFLVEQLLLASSESNIAWAAHLGGFGLGVAFGLGWRWRSRVPDSARR